jgi:biopolymer transport protein ExbD
MADDSASLGSGTGKGGAADALPDETPLNSTINTTPLVDIMLVMLIIFLITVPVVVANIKVELPNEKNVAVQTKPENVNLAVDAAGTVYWNTTPVDEAELARRLAIEAPKVPQPEVHIRGDGETEYLNVGKVVEAAQKAGIAKVGFITKAPAPNGY